MNRSRACTIVLSLLVVLLPRCTELSPVDTDVVASADALGSNQDSAKEVQPEPTCPEDLQCAPWEECKQGKCHPLKCAGGGKLVGLDCAAVPEEGCCWASDKVHLCLPLTEQGIACPNGLDQCVCELTCKGELFCGYNVDSHACVEVSSDPAKVQECGVCEPDCTNRECGDDGCGNLCGPDTQCDDGAPCNGVEACAEGTCVAGNAVVVDDGIDCTIDTCDQETGLPVHETSDLACSTEEPCKVSVCDPDGEGADPTTGCMLMPDDKADDACDDGNPCTVDGCSNGKCVNPWLTLEELEQGDLTLQDCACESDEACSKYEDGDACNGVPACDQETGYCVVSGGSVLDCDDLNACTDDSCDPVLGCTHESVTIDDGDACTVDECDPVEGVSHEQLDCDDGNPCTVDGCSNGKCVNPWLTPEELEQGDLTIQDCACESDEDCVKYEDGDACNGVPDCDQESGKCHVSTETIPMCDNGNACDGVETCDPLTGECLPGVSIDPDDGVECTIDDCDEETGKVSNVPINAACGDGDECTNDVCDPVLGCGHFDIDVSDSDPCTVDSCVKGEVVHLPVQCDDGDACNGVEICNADSGECEAGAPVATDDGVECTVDTCDPETGAVAHVVDHALCNDEDLCTDDTCDAVAGCVHVLIDADDDDLCTADSCDPAKGVSHTPVDCADGNQCTNDSCTPEFGCTYTIVDCDDDDLCTTDDCEAGAGCIFQPVTCDDGNPCTVDSCLVAEGCISQPTSGGEPCSEDLHWQCQDGACVCVPNCADLECGDDGCGGSCGECTGGWECVEGECTTEGFPLKNGGFENGLDDWANGDSYWGSSYGSFSLSSDAHTGQTSVDAGSTGKLMHQYFEVGVLGVSSGRLHWWVKGDCGTPSGKYITVGLFFYDAGDVMLSQVQSKCYGPQDGWTEMTADFQVPDGSETLDVAVTTANGSGNGPGPSEAVVDDIWLEVL